MIYTHSKRRSTISAGLILVALFSCLVVAHPAIEDRGLSIRAAGEVSEFVDPAQPTTREINTPLFAAGLTAIAGVTYAACQATAPINPAVAITVCVVGAVSTWLAGLFAIYKSLGRRELDIDGTAIINWNGVEYKHYFPAIEGGPSSFELWQANFTGTPILVAHHTCMGLECYEAYYSNHFNAELGKTVHSLRTQPRIDELSASIRKRADSLSGLDTGAHGGKLYVDYTFINDNAANEKAEANASGEKDEILKVIGAETGYTKQGNRCITILDGNNGKLPGSQGYLTIVQNQQIADPDNEATYIAECK